ncbi:MAG: hypothetical protein ACPGVD_09465 [Flavobacteriales bacterium]
MFDSIRVSLKHKPKLYANYGTRNAFFSNQRIQVRDISLGVTFNRQFTLAIGYNWLVSDFQKIYNTEDTAKFKLRYITPFVEYSFLEKNNIEVTIPIYLGFGNSRYQTEDKKIFEKQFVMLYEPGMKVTFRFFRYFGVSGGVGVRMILAGNRQLNQPFLTPTYTVGAKLFLGDIYKDVKKAFE